MEDSTSCEKIASRYDDDTATDTGSTIDWLVDVLLDTNDNNTTEAVPPADAPAGANKDNGKEDDNDDHHRTTITLMGPMYPYDAEEDGTFRGSFVLADYNNMNMHNNMNFTVDYAVTGKTVVVYDATGRPMLCGALEKSSNKIV